MTFGEKLQNLRKSKGLSQEQLAEQISVSRQAISKWEIGESNPDIENIIQISNTFNVSIDYLLKDESLIVNEVTVTKIHQEKQLDKKSHSFIIGLVFLSMSFIGLMIFWILSIVEPSFNIKKENLYSFLLILFCSLGIVGIFLIMYKKLKNLSKKTKIIIAIAFVALFLLLFLISLLLSRTREINYGSTIINVICESI
ncbi:MAG TPA: hypothetical protein DCP51_07555 [Clostridiales bacterium]|nr:hypothetical protein [Clostridiales bacterium]